jgi:hypothetical protein
MIVQILCALLITVGLFFIFKVHPSDMIGKLSKPFVRRRDKMNGYAASPASPKESWRQP